MKTVSLDNFVIKFEEDFNVKFDKKMPNKWIPDINNIKSDYIRFVQNPLIHCFDGSQDKYNRMINSKLTRSTRIKYKKCFKKINNNLRLIYLFYHNWDLNTMGLLVSFELKGVLEQVYFDTLFKEHLSNFSNYSKVFKNHILDGFSVNEPKHMEFVFDIMDIVKDGWLNDYQKKIDKIIIDEMIDLEMMDKYLELDDYIFEYNK